MKRALTPCIVTADRKYQPLTRLEFADRRVVEEFLQVALNRNPTLLPVNEIDPAFGPLLRRGTAWAAGPPPEETRRSPLRRALITLCFTSGGHDLTSLSQVLGQPA